MTKKLLLIAAAVIIVAQCRDDCRFRSILKDDYKSVISQYPDAENGLQEVQIILTDSIHLANPKKVDVLSMNEMYQATDSAGVKYVVFNEHNLRTGEVNRYTKLGQWYGDAHIGLPAIKYSIPDAIRILRRSKIALPKTNIVTFRHPLYTVRSETQKVFMNPVYIFGSKHTHFVFVDAVTGECGFIDEHYISGLYK